jgi:hypothetical protein
MEVGSELSEEVVSALQQLHNDGVVSTPNGGLGDAFTCYPREHERLGVVGVVMVVRTAELAKELMALAERWEQKLTAAPKVLVN